jgi:hypothetical protein
MNKFWLISMLVFLLFSVSQAQNTDWKEFVSEEGRFKAAFPFVPVKSVKEMDAGNGKIESIRFEISLAEPEIYFGVWYVDFPNAPTMNEEMLRANYNALRNGYKQNPNFELLGEREVRVNGKPGLELTMKTGNSTAKSQTFWLGKRNFQIITIVKSSLFSDANIQKNMNKFLDSFQFIEK